MTNVISFNYNTNVIRTQVTDDGEPLFCLKDICAALEISDASNAARQLREEFSEGAVLNTDPLVTIRMATSGGSQELLFITEPQLYFLMMRSRSDKAKPFRQWVVNDVLPSIRKTGKYEAPKSEALSVERKLNAAKIILEPAGIKGNQLTLALDKVYKANTGESLLAQAGVELVRPQQTQLSTPTELGNDMGLSGREVNKLLAEMGLQTKEGGKWQPTQKGLAAGATILDTGKKRSSGVPVTQLKWPSDLFSAERYRADR